MTDGIVVMTTTETQADGERLAHVLVEANLAACVQILPQMTSVYRWKDQIEYAKENLILIKTTRNAYPGVEAAIKGAHQYETPEIIAVPVEAGSAAYLAWLLESVEA